MPLASLIGAHGYWLLAGGCFLEGETILVLAGFAAHLGYLDPAAVVAIAAVAGFAGDQFYFWLGRRHGPAVLARFPSVARQAERVHRLMDRYHTYVIIGVRFAYGLRIAGPILIGTAPVSALRFALLNALGAIMWSILVAGSGWFFGHAAEALLGDIERYEAWAIAALLVLAAIVWWIRRTRAH